MGKQTLSFLKGSNRNFDNVLDSYLNLTDGGTVASKTAFSGGLTTGIKSTDATAGFVNDMHLSGLNPTWAVNFGGILKGQITVFIPFYKLNFNQLHSDSYRKDEHTSGDKIQTV